MLIPVGFIRISRFYYSYSFIVPICIGTAVNSICLRTCVSSYPRLCFKAGAKLEILFVSCKKNLKNFETFFSSPFFVFLTSLSRNFPCFAGCKCKSFFRIPQAFSELFFREIYSPHPVCLSVFRWTSFVVAGAKVAPLSSYTSFLSAFFCSFFNLFLN